jgi:hypothetical protein
MEKNLEGCLENVIKDAESYANSLVLAYAKDPRRKKGTPLGRVKVTLNEMRTRVFLCRMLGELSAAERLLQFLRDDKEILSVKDPQEMKDLILGELHIFVKDLNNTIANAIDKKHMGITVDMLIKRDFVDKKTEEDTTPL